jgi:hypothetical protein
MKRQPSEGDREPHDIPELLPDHSGDGHAWIERLPAGWEAVPSWGRDGWDLGAWPLCVVAAYDNPDANAFAVGVYTEGDMRVTHHSTQLDLYIAIDEVAEWYWRHEYAIGPKDLPEGEGLLLHHRGPFNWARLREYERNRDAEA